MNDEFLIQLEILGKKYPLRIPRKDEEVMRKAAKQLEKKYDEYTASYDVEDMEKSGRELMALVAFEFALKSLRAGDEVDLLPFVKRVETLNTEVTGYLAENKPL